MEVREHSVPYQTGDSEDYHVGNACDIVFLFCKELSADQLSRESTVLRFGVVSIALSSSIHSQSRFMSGL